ncbi:glycoside hydrolase family 140 protein [Pollutibacter soli]|uniref:glycoside hydrolase family 140 protein n=1 Tax=Pollutibacter soli TaxID=3034157 RepID=UPI0030139AD0
MHAKKRSFVSIKSVFVFLLVLSIQINSYAQLRVSENKRYLVAENGTPFFWLGDTAWELFHRLNRAEADKYLGIRASQGFTVIQAVVLAEMDGINTPNAYNEKPLEDADPTKPREAYFKHVDYIIDKAASLGLYIGLLPTWGDKVFKDRWGAGPEVFNPTNARIYGEWIGKRYADRKNIIWILGGDRNPRNDQDIAIWRAMAAGIEAGAGGADKALMTFHPQPNDLQDAGSAKWFHNDAWLDFNMFQTGHCRDNRIWDRLQVAYNLKPTKPVIDGETLYEDHPVCFNAKENGISSAYDIRKHAWLDVMAGGFGHTYGCHDIWQMYTPEREPVNGAHIPWYEAVNLQGALQMKYLRRLIESRPMLERVPDQTILKENSAEHDRIQASRGNSYIIVYSTQGKSFELQTGKISGSTYSAFWYNPRNGQTQSLPAADNKKSFVKFQPPSSDYGNDWVLVVDDASKNYPVPTSR